MGTYSVVMLIVARVPSVHLLVVWTISLILVSSITILLIDLRSHIGGRALARMQTDRSR